MGTKTGGPAFPHGEALNFETSTIVAPSTGMALRDYFAAHAPGAPEDFGWAPGEVDSWQRRARWSYVYADAMLAAREEA